MRLIIRDGFHLDAAPPNDPVTHFVDVITPKQLQQPLAAVKPSKWVEEGLERIESFAVGVTIDDVTDGVGERSEQHVQNNFSHLLHMPKADGSSSGNHARRQQTMYHVARHTQPPTPGAFDCSEGSVVSCSWEQEIDLGLIHGGTEITADTVIEFVLLSKPVAMLDPMWATGGTRMTVGEIVAMEENDDGRGVELMMFRNDGAAEVLATKDGNLASIVRVNVVEESLPASLRKVKVAARERADRKMKEGQKAYEKRIMIMTRGTRGDVQPFLALSIGLAEMRNWEVILVTELTFKEKVQYFRDVSAGAIRYRPSGGNTARRVDQKISQTIINFKSDEMQKLILSRSECEFFPSEAAFYYWAKKLRPDFMLYGFTTASIALLISEALQIPAVGFIFQPTIIPSNQYPPVLPLSEEAYEKLTAAAMKNDHRGTERLKTLQDYGLLEPFANSIGKIRESRGLQRYRHWQTNTWMEVLRKNIPVIVPINEKMFGGKPNDWSENAIFTDCIFLRGDSVPQIADDAQAFLEQARSRDAKVIVLAFSSMPVTKTDIVSISLKVINECTANVCVFALVGKQVEGPFHAKIKNSAEEALADGKLFLASVAPFGRLFPLVDAVVLHGGLGTTSEVLQAQIPAIVTGVLLLDQRFWGARCAELNVGPYGIHIKDFPSKCVEIVDKALKDGSEWKTNARAFGKILAEESADDPSGVRRNVECVERMCNMAVPYWYNRDDDHDENDTTNTPSSMLGKVKEGMMHFPSGPPKGS